MKRSTVHAMTLVVLLALLAGCGAGKPRAGDAGKAPAVLDQRLTALAAGQQGFKCEGSDTYSACACVQGSVGVWTCKGMARMCRTMGAGTPTCSEGVCSCERHT